MLPATNVMRDNSHLSSPTSSMGGLEEGQTPTDTDSQVVFNFPASKLSWMTSRVGLDNHNIAIITSSIKKYIIFNWPVYKS